jgi:hypothetical protein
MAGKGGVHPAINGSTAPHVSSAYDAAPVNGAVSPIDRA